MPVGDLEHLIKEYRCGIVAEEVSAEALASAIREAVATGEGAFRENAGRANELFDIRNAAARWLGSGAHDRKNKT
jgi:hypothetical protein